MKDETATDSRDYKYDVFTESDSALTLDFKSEDRFLNK